MNVSVSGNIDHKMYLKKFRGGFSPLSPPGSAYVHRCILNTICSLGTTLLQSGTLIPKLVKAR